MKIQHWALNSRNMANFDAFSSIINLLISEE